MKRREDIEGFFKVSQNKISNDDYFIVKEFGFESNGFIVMDHRSTGKTALLNKIENDISGSVFIGNSHRNIEIKKLISKKTKTALIFDDLKVNEKKMLRRLNIIKKAIENKNRVFVSIDFDSIDDIELIELTDFAKENGLSLIYGIDKAKILYNKMKHNCIDGEAYYISNIVTVKRRVF